jgi:hypothetical protein
VQPSDAAVGTHPQVSYAIAGKAENIVRGQQVRLSLMVFIYLHGVSVIAVESLSGTYPEESDMILVDGIDTV